MAFNTAYTDVAYSGYMYPNAPTTSSILNMNNDTLNKNNSDMKTYLDTWYDTNLSAYSTNIADTIYCADRTISEGTKYAGLTNTKNPYGKNIVFYGGFDRLAAESSTATWAPRSDASPQYLCERMEDSFTVDSTKGNGKLTKAIGLITIDEAAYAGGLFYNSNGSSANNSYYLYTGSDYWIMDSSRYDNAGARVSIIHSTGELGNHGVNSTNEGVLPAVSLTPETKVDPSGTGTASNPYVVK